MQAAAVKRDQRRIGQLADAGTRGRHTPAVRVCVEVDSLRKAQGHKEMFTCGVGCYVAADEAAAALLDSREPLLRQSFCLGSYAPPGERQAAVCTWTDTDIIAIAP